MMKTLNLNTLIERHVLFKTIQELNEKLTKNREVFLIDLGDMVKNFFDDQTLFHWEEKGYFDFDTNTLNIDQQMKIYITQIQ